MMLSDQQRQEFDRDGFLIFPGLLSSAEIDVLRRETERLKGVECSYTTQERTGAVRSVYRVHEDYGETQSAAFRALSRTPRMLGTAQQLLGDEDVYVFHTKINFKPAIEGTIWAWHQDYGTWRRDGVPRPDMVTYLVMLDDADEVSGALYLVAGSHRDGTLPHAEDASVGALNQYSVSRPELVKSLRSGRIVPVRGPAGTVAVFHCNVVHGSGHNMSPNDRRQVYYVYTPTVNAPAEADRIRGDHLSSRNQSPIVPGPDDGILAAASAGRPQLEKA